MKLEEIQAKKLQAIAKKIIRRVREMGYREPDYYVDVDVHADQQRLDVTMDYNTFLADSSHDEQYFNRSIDDVKAACSGHGELRVEDGEHYFGGGAASSLIKRGRKVNADALLSDVQVIVKFASNFK